jgi:RNA polymerase sigma factor (sigma-70 family)
VSGEGSVTHWFEQVREADSLAARALWERYFPQLVRLAREKLRGAPRRASDEEDVASSVMESLFRAAEQGRLPNLADRDDLWRLLLRMTARKVVDLRRHEARQRRGGGRVKGESALGRAGAPYDPAAIAEVIGDAPTPEFAAMMIEQRERLFAQLGDPDLKALASAKLEGYTNEEIAEQLGCSLRTVERRLHLIRKKWERGQAP